MPEEAGQPTVTCTGDGAPQCDSSCKSWMRPDCNACQCIMCNFCADSRERAASPSPPPPPWQPPPTPFTCDMLHKRKNLRLDENQKWCYVLTNPAECESAYTYETHADRESDLRLCRSCANGKQCDYLRIEPNQYSSPYCQGLLAFSPPPPSILSTPSPQSPPPLPLPSQPPHPPSPPPCLQLSAKCGGTGWSGLTVCCQTAAAKADCVKKDDRLSQCRTDCPADWACDERKEPIGAHPLAVDERGSSPPPSSPPPPHKPKGGSALSLKVVNRTAMAESPTPLAVQPRPALPESTPSLVRFFIVMSVLLVIVSCIACLCRRWFNKGIAKRKGKRLTTGEATEAGDWIAEEGPSAEMLPKREETMDSMRI